MKNIGLPKLETATVDNFTTDTGITIRKMFNRPLRKVFKLAAKRNIHVEAYPILEKDKPYIFTSTHSYDEDIISGLAAIDRHAYVLIGTTDQLEYNPQMYAAWLNGMIYVDRLDSYSRKDALEKMKRILKSGTSVLIFPEGGWNNTENLMCQKLFSSPYLLSQETGIPVVPIANFNEHNSKDIYINVGEPINVENMNKKEYLQKLRDKLSELMYIEMEKHTSYVKRSELGIDCRTDFMEERRKEYMRVKWTMDVWDEELTVYSDKDNPTPTEIRKSLNNVHITKENCSIFLPYLKGMVEDEKYDFKKYMKER